MIHTAVICDRDDGFVGWKCSCGQSSYSPWTLEIAKQQMIRHVEELRAYDQENTVVKSNSFCDVCEKPVTLGDPGVMTFNISAGRGAHRQCVADVTTRA